MLRGINVGGRKSIKMEKLVALYESLGFINVKTYVQSGNVVFDSPRSSPEGLSNDIESKIKEVFDLRMVVLLRTSGEIQRIISSNPFFDEGGLDNSKLYVTFLSGIPSETGLTRVKETHDGPDRFAIVDREIYLYCPNGYGRARFSNTFFEKKLGVSATTRNWRTVNALFRLTRNQAG